jgi:hypothetical protein
MTRSLKHPLFDGTMKFDGTMNLPAGGNPPNQSWIVVSRRIAKPGSSGNFQNVMFFLKLSDEGWSLFRFDGIETGL